MATERQNRANARNAKKSTGPRSTAGKARVSRNARSHGLTTPPPFEDVLTYYRIILEDRQADPADAASDADQAALRLAECEAACDRALEAERKAVHDMATDLRTRGERDPLRLAEAEWDLDNPAVLEMMMRGGPAEDSDDAEENVDALADMGMMTSEEEDAFTEEALRILYAMARNNLARRRRTLERIALYRQRAEGRRRRAFRSWLRASGKNDNSKPISRIG